MSPPILLLLIQEWKAIATGRFLINSPQNNNNNNNNNKERRYSRFTLVKIALSSRILVLLALALSCRLLPNHNPGDDVFRFSLRFSDAKDISGACFCLPGQACDKESSKTSLLESPSNAIGNRDARHRAERVPSSSSHRITTAVYDFLLTPLTRWDASRFLDLAVYPYRRDPPRHLRREFPQCQGNGHPEAAVCEELFLPTEQAHAFFPMLPLIIRVVANYILLPWVPREMLPPTYEGVAILAALLWNILAFVLASLALYDLTWTLTRQHVRKLQQDVDADDPNYKMGPKLVHDCRRLAFLVFLLFCFNPASVFFTTAYSESLFALCHFGGHALWARWPVSMIAAQREQHNNHHHPMLCLLASLVVLSLWMAASYTRSNGSINSCFLLLQGIGLVCLWIPKGPPLKAAVGFILCVTFAFCVLYPVFLHDAQGYERHCVLLLESDSFVTPSWCLDSNSTERRFSLYGYIQRKHWNVGIFRYYTWKKIPNFLLAAPILVLGVSAPIDWIHASYNRYVVSQQRAMGVDVPSRSILQTIVGWAIGALRASVAWRERGSTRAETTSQRQAKSTPTTNIASWVNVQLLLGPHMLAHFAVLAAVCFVGILVAHIEITTRMICSSCPAIYWYMALLSCGSGEARSGDTRVSVSWWSKTKNGVLGVLVLPYCFLYIFLGVIMHPNWLPWT